MSWTTLMDAYVKEDACAAEKCEDAMKQMRAGGVEPNVASWNTLMKAYASDQNGAEKCEIIMIRMRENGAKPNVVSWTTLMKAYVKAHDGAAKCEDAMKRMMDDKVTPNVITWTTLMNAYVNHPNGVAECKKVMDRMQRNGIKPNVESWNTLMNAHKGNGDSCLWCLDQMQSASLAPNKFTVTILFHALAQGLHGSALSGALKIRQLYGELVREDSLDHLIAGSVLCALGDVGTAAEVDAFWNLCAKRRRKSRWPASFEACLLDGAARKGGQGQWRRIEQLVASLQPRQLQRVAVASGSPLPAASLGTTDPSSRSLDRYLGANPFVPASRCTFIAGGGSASEQPCWYFQRGHCLSGSSCPFTH
jgi:pentatricopeptide repeat protein